MTLEQIRAGLESAHPELTEVIEGKHVVLSSEDRADTLDRWAAVDYATQAKIAAAEAASLRAAARATMREQWDGLPAWIRGPFQPLFSAANALLDEGDDDAAAEMIRYAVPPQGYTTKQATTFAQVKQQFADAFAALKG